MAGWGLASFLRILNNGLMAPRFGVFWFSKIFYNGGLGRGGGDKMSRGGKGTTVRSNLIANLMVVGELVYEW